MRLFAIDLDGTCINSKQQITDRTLCALRKAAEAGIEIVPTTGRTRTCLPFKLQKEPYIRYMITSNGARVTDTKTGKVIYTAPISSIDALSLIDECTKQRFGVTAHIDDEYIVQGKFLHLLGRIVYGREAGNAVCVKDIHSRVNRQGGTFDELQFFFFSSEATNRAQKILSEYDLITTYSHNYAEVFSQKANKGKALTVLADHLMIPQKQIACIGDGENDIFMFQASGLNFAMGNAVDQLKADADYVVPTNDNNGVAEAIEKHLL